MTANRRSSSRINEIGDASQSSNFDDLMRRKALAITTLGSQPAYTSTYSPLVAGSKSGLSNPQPLSPISQGGEAIVDPAGRHAAGGGGVGGPLPTGDLSTVDTDTASQINALRQNPNGTAEVRTTTGATIKIRRAGNRVTGKNSDDLGSLSFSGDYVDIPHQPSVRIANMRMTPSLGTLVSSPTSLTISRNINKHIVFQFDKDVSLRALFLTKTPYKGQEAYRLNP
jgi:hypothetical protein